MTFTAISQLIGGLAMFLAGSELASAGLRRASGGGLRHLLRRFTVRPVPGLLAGVALSVALQSSSAATVLLVSLADAGLVSLAQSLPVTLGAALGATVTVQIITFDIGGYALLLLAAGVLTRWVCRYDRHKRLGDAVFGVGLLFYGMTLMTAGGMPLAKAPGFQAVLSHLGKSPLLGVVVSAVITGLIQSSSAMIAVVISVLVSRVTAGLAPLEAIHIAMPFILGANIGASATALIASAAASRAGKQTALGNLILKVAGVLVCLPFVYNGWFDGLCWRFTGFFVNANQPAPAVARAIANAHTIFNIVACVVFLPFTAAFARLVSRLLPITEPALLTRSLAPRLLAMPALALDAVAAEVRNTAVQVRDMHSLAGRAVLEPNRAAVDELRNADTGIDGVLAEVTQYALRLSQQDIGPDAARRREILLIALRNMEQIGDLLSTDLARQALKRIDQGIDFSPEGLDELKGVFGEVGQSFDNTLLSLAGGANGPVREVLDREERMDGERRTLFERHLERLIRKDPRTARSLTIHMDVLTALRQVHSLLADTVRALADKPHPTPPDIPPPRITSPAQPSAPPALPASD